MMRQYELVETVRGYDPGADEDLLNRAYVFTVKAHGAQTRESGDPYFSHPVEVAGILAGMRLDSASIVTGLLHDTVEDTVATMDDIEAQFGPEVARLVDGVTKLSRLRLGSTGSEQAENFRKLLLAMSQDIRVLLVKLADRLHNMRTLQFIPKEAKRQRIARETLDIYAPLAERIGIRDWKDELEDLAFATLHPEIRTSIVRRLEFLRARGTETVGKVIADLQRALAAAALTAEVTGREKTPHSIWQKMQRRNVGFEQLADIMAFRVVVDTEADCYNALGAIHGAWRVVPGRFKDYISSPKRNAYRSIHTGVVGPGGQRIEVQIRTHEMHRIAEYGVAAHWSYKAGEITSDASGYRWLRELLDILEHTTDPDEFLEHTKLEMFQDQVFVFTPKGEVIALPRGATPVDFAYAVHSEVGNTCVGAKVNGRMMPLRTALQNGDQVEILTSRAQTPSPTWERIAVTGRARAHIRRFIRQRQRSEYIHLGREITARAFRQMGYDVTGKALEEARARMSMATVDDLHATVGQGLHTGREVVMAVYPGAADRQAQDGKSAPAGRARPAGARSRRASAGRVNGHAVSLRGLIPGMAVHFAGCCHPLPGDRIVGIVTTGKGVTVHTIDCETLESYADMPERWLDVAWNMDDDTAGG
ncbi:MAG: bifunctional (p)ppGpp synthetase/guanosine-3',5'-bis(diphosphate) 3'-pyrophosphohydrolase, partial [Alphaproteobacteria bacterium]